MCLMEISASIQNTHPFVDKHKNHRLAILHFDAPQYSNSVHTTMWLFQADCFNDSALKKLGKFFSQSPQ